MTTDSTLTAARGGDGRAFEALVDPYRRELHAHCYRMLASLHDADDALQEALLRAWRALPRFEERSSLRTWLYRIATNCCLRAIERRPRRELPIEHGPAVADPHAALDPPLAESTWITPYPDEQLRYEQRESVELAFVAALQQLPANQRAALIVREVLGFSAREAAAMLETSEASINSAVQRARRAVDERRPALSQQAALRTLGDGRVETIVAGYMAALERADVPAMVELLTADVSWSMPPTPSWYSGIDAVVEFLVAKPFTSRWRHVPCRANGQLAVGCYAWDGERYAASVIDVLDLRGDRIAAVTAFVGAELFPRFGLPAER